MESSLATNNAGVSAQDLPEAAALLDQAGPFASVVIATHHDEAQSNERFAASWGECRRTLRDRGAPDRLLGEMEQWLMGARTDAPGLACVATVDGPIVGAAGPAPTHELATWDSLPRLTTFLEWHQSSPPALLVTVDRTGADIFASGPADTTNGLIDVVESLVEDADLRRSKPGGWSQRRFQQAAMENWRANAGQVASAIDAAVERLGARLVVIAGDDHAVSDTCDQLGARAKGLVRRASGGRGPGSQGHLEDDARRWYRSAVAEETRSLIERFNEELGQRDLGVAGLDGVLPALQMAAVDTLLLHDDPRDARRLFFRTGDRTSVASSEADLEGVDLADGPLPDVLLRATWGSGARVRLVPRLPQLADDVGALLRFPTPD